MTLPAGLVVMKSGTWRWSVQQSGRVEFLELTMPGVHVNKMRVPLPFSWRQLSRDEMLALADCPEMRLWTDEDGTFWRISAVGFGTPFFYDLLDCPCLVFDSERTWARVVKFPAPVTLGQLNDDELRALRDLGTEFGGRRKAYRSPSHNTPSR
jgi:hypothetical protein